MLREGAFLVPFASDKIDPATLNEVTRQALAIPGVVEVYRGEGRVDQGEQAAEGFFIPGMRGRGQKDYSPVWIACQFGKKLEPLLLALLRANAGVSFVYDYEIRTGPSKAIAALVGLDVVEADDCEGIGVEQGLGERQAALQSRGRASSDRGGFDAEAGLQFADPLLDEVRRAQHGKRIDFSSIHQFAQDEAGLDGLPDPDVIGDEQARRLKAKRHQQGNKLAPGGEIAGATP